MVKVWYKLNKILYSNLKIKQKCKRWKIYNLFVHQNFIINLNKHTHIYIYM